MNGKAIGSPWVCPARTTRRGTQMTTCGHGSVEFAATNQSDNAHRRHNGLMDSLDELRRLALFAYVVNAGGLAAAARQIGLTRSAISKQISLLERTVGTRLIQQTSRQLRLTEAGTRLYESAARIVAELEQATHIARGLGNQVSGTLRVTAPLYLGEHIVIPLLGDFLREHDQLTLQLLLDDLYVDIIGESLDIALRIGLLPDSSLHARRLSALDQVVCAAPSYVNIHGTPDNPDQLASHECILYSFDDEPLRWTFLDRGRPRDVRVRGRIWVNTSGALRGLALAGAGLVMLTELMVADALADGRLVRVLPDYPVPSSALYALYPSRKLLSPKVRAFVDYLAERIPAAIRATAPARP